MPRPPVGVTGRRRSTHPGSTCRHPAASGVGCGPHRPRPQRRRRRLADDVAWLPRVGNSGGPGSPTAALPLGALAKQVGRCPDSFPAEVTVMGGACAIAASSGRHPRCAGCRVEWPSEEVLHAYRPGARDATRGPASDPSPRIRAPQRSFTAVGAGVSSPSIPRARTLPGRRDRAAGTSSLGSAVRENCWQSSVPLMGTGWCR
jgi:hypothetical protein